jgi:hypothetical protein
MSDNPKIPTKATTDKKEAVYEYLDDTCKRCELARHTGTVMVAVRFFVGKIQSAKATWEDDIVK